MLVLFWFVCFVLSAVVVESSVVCVFAGYTWARVCGVDVHDVMYMRCVCVCVCVCDALEMRTYRRSSGVLACLCVDLVYF